MSSVPASAHTPQATAPGARRLGGLLLAFSALVAFAAQTYSMLQWQGLYSLSENLMSDLGATECDLANDGYLSRYVCSPGHALFNAGMIFSGALLAIGAVVIFLAARRSPWGKSISALLLISGVGVLVAGAVPFDVNSAVHDAAALTATVATLVAMALFADSRRGGDRATVQPLGYGPFAPATWVMFVISAVGLVLLLMGWDRPGLWERLAMDVQTMWLILVGLSLIRVSPSERARARAHTVKEDQAAKNAAVIEATQRSGR